MLTAKTKVFPPIKTIPKGRSSSQCNHGVMGKRDWGAVCQGSVMRFLCLLFSLFSLSPSLGQTGNESCRLITANQIHGRQNQSSLHTEMDKKHIPSLKERGVVKTVQHLSVIYWGVWLRLIFSLDILQNLPISVSTFQSENMNFHLVSQKETLAAYVPTIQQVINSTLEFIVFIKHQAKITNYYQ